MAGEKVVVLKEVFRGGQARYDRYHLFLYRNKVIGIVQERAGETAYVVYQPAESLIRLELSDGGRSNKQPPILEVFGEGKLIFRTILGGPRPKPLNFGNVFKFIPCVLGAADPREVWGSNVQIEEIGKDKDSSSEGGETLQI